MKRDKSITARGQWFIGLLGFIWLLGAMVCMRTGTVEPLGAAGTLTVLLCIGYAMVFH